MCALSKGLAPNSFLSSSWDNTAKLWNLDISTTKALVTFTGHEAAVWHVKQLSNEQIATASADKTVGLWTQTGQRVNTLSGMINFNMFIRIIKNGSFVWRLNSSGTEMKKQLDEVLWL